MVRQCGAPSAQNTTIYCAEFALIQLGREARTEALIIHVWPTFDPAALRLHVASFPLSFVLWPLSAIKAVRLQEKCGKHMPSMTTATTKRGPQKANMWEMCLCVCDIAVHWPTLARDQQRGKVHCRESEHANMDGDRHSRPGKKKESPWTQFKCASVPAAATLPLLLGNCGDCSL